MLGIAGNNNGVTSLDSWGSNLTLVGGVESMRIDIVVSELGKGSFDTDSGKKQRTSKPSSAKTKSSGIVNGIGTICSLYS